MQRHASSAVLIAVQDPERSARITKQIARWDYSGISVTGADEIRQWLTRDPGIPVILDLDCAANDGSTALMLLGELLLEGLRPRTVFVTDQHSGTNAERALQMGAYAVVRTADGTGQLRRALTEPSGPALHSRSRNLPLIGTSPAMQELRQLVRACAGTNASVMITGESGTGKELVAQAIHNCSPRSGEKMVAVNMAAVPESLVESVLFGHEKGAFTGADSRQMGLCEQAHGGTLFLDEIGEMHLNLQPKLLRFLQEFRVQRVGGTTSQSVDVRVISATNMSVQSILSEGCVRDDLFFRLHVIPLHIPPLRERPEDIPRLADAFLESKCLQNQRSLHLSREVLEWMSGYSWPGNVRQLENLVERLVVLAKSPLIQMTDLPVSSLEHSAMTTCGSSVTNDARAEAFTGNRTLSRIETAERNLILDALRRHQGHAGRAAAFLGMGKATIYRKIQSLEIRPDVFRRGDHVSADPVQF